MIRKFIDRLLRKSSAPVPPLPADITLGRRVEVGREVHGIDPRLVAEPAQRVVHTLKRHGYEAYIVGGAVRDLLLGLRPKDFDVATNATPEQVKLLFKRAYIVGRRFRLVHVIHGRGREHEQIEVSTFRAYVDAADAQQVVGNDKTARDAMAGKSHVVDAEGRVLRDNVWGPQVEDAARRDFTVNAMYYDPETQIVVDYHGGLGDAKARVLRMIGDPEVRYREDPVRIVRVLRFAAKLGFDIEARSEAPIRPMKALLANVPASRMFDEMIKLLQTGHSLASLTVLQRYGLERGVFPILDAHFEGVSHDPKRAAFVERALADTDRRVAEGKPVAPSFLLACMFWHEVAGRWQAARAGGEPATPALQQAIDATFDARIGDISGRGKLAADMREIWMMQPRFDKRVGNGPFALVQQPRFRAGYDFLRLCCDAGEADPELARWWDDFFHADEAARQDMVEAQVQAGGPRRGAKGARGAKAGARTDRTAGTASGGDAGAAVEAVEAGDAGAAPDAGEPASADRDEADELPAAPRAPARPSSAQQVVAAAEAALADGVTDADRQAARALFASLGLMAPPAADANERRRLMHEVAQATEAALGEAGGPTERALALALVEQLERKAAAGPNRRRRGGRRRSGGGDAGAPDAGAKGRTLPVPERPAGRSPEASAAGSARPPQRATPSHSQAGPASHRPGDPTSAPVHVFVGLGANLGDARATLQAAVETLKALACAGEPDWCLSSWWRSAPVEATGPDFLNAVAGFRTRHTALELLAALQAIEQRFGRERPYVNAPRTLDLDLLLYDVRGDDGGCRGHWPGLELPHPRAHRRRFVLEPLHELWPAGTIPGCGNLQALLQAARADASQRIDRVPA